MTKRLKRIGIFGGSFDPPHLGHLLIAEMARLTLDLDLVFFVPAYRPPHKEGKHPSTSRDRLQMARLSIRGNEALRVSDIEIRRRGVSYTIDTVREFRRRFRARELFLIVGEDSLKQFPTWKNPKGILEACTLAVYRRPHAQATRVRVPAARVRWIKGPLMDVSSSEIRERIRERKSIRYLVRDNVLEFITEKRLYRTPS